MATFSGSASKNTPPFAIQSNRWRVTWSCAPDAQANAVLSGTEKNTLIGFCADAKSDDGGNDEQEIVDKLGPGSDTTELRGAGNWRLEINAGNCDWTVTVEEFR